MAAKKKFVIPTWFWLLIVAVNGLLLSMAWRYPVKLLAIFILEVAIIWWQDQRKGDEMWVLVPAVLGPLVEIVAVAGGAWAYSTEYLFGVPLWLPALYAVAGLVMRRLIERK